MATFQYKPSTTLISSPATQYNVNPNNTVARGVENLQRAILGGMQVKAEMNDELFKKQQIDQRNTINQLRADWDGASYEQQQLMIKEIPSQVLDRYQGDDLRTQQLRSVGIDFMSNLESNLKKTGIQVEHNNIITQQNLGFMDSGERFNSTGDLGGKRKIVDEYYEMHVAPYEGINDPKAQDLYNRGIENWTELNSTYKGVVKQRADQRITTDVLTSLQVELQKEGYLSPERYSAMRENLQRRSDWADNKTQILAEFDKTVLIGMRGVFNNPDVPQTAETAAQYMQHLQDFTEVSPFIIGTTAYNDAVSFGNTLKNAADRQDMSNIQAMLVDDTLSPKDFKVRTSELRQRGLMSEEEENSLNFRKTEQVRERKVKPQIANYLQVDDFDGIKVLISEGQVANSTVETMMKDGLAFSHSSILESQGLPQANAYVLSEYSKYKQNGFILSNLPEIDSILEAPSNGGIQSNEDVMNFLDTTRLAQDAGYRPSKNGRVAQDYAILNVWAKNGVPDIAEKWQTYKQDPIRVSDKEVDTAFAAIIDIGDTFSEDLNPRNVRQLRDTFRPALKAAMRAGIDPDELTNEWESIINMNYIRPDPSWGGSSEVLIPISLGVRDEESYNRVFEAVNREANNGLRYLAPQYMDQPSGPWMGFDKNGQPYTFPYEVIEEAAKTGLLP